MKALGILTILALLMPGLVVPANAALTPTRTYTLDADFDEGVYSNVVHSTPDQLQLDDTTTPFRFIWVAVSSKGTIVKIDTDTGAVLGEYWTSPEGQPKNPSRTTVDLNGNVWNTNRNGHSVVQVGLKENGQCVDRNGNGTIETSTGLGDVRAWPGSDASTAEDECILKYVLVSAWGTRHLSVTAENNVWVSGYASSNSGVFDLVDGATGTILRTEGPVGYGGYGGLIDGNGVIWSSQPLLRWDTSLPLSGPNAYPDPATGNWTGYPFQSYGLCIDSGGNVWNTTYGEGVIRKYSPAGLLLGTYSEGNQFAQGCVVDGNDHVWVAHSLNGNSVGHLLNDGSYVGTVAVGTGPTGVAVDALGKIWATNYSDRTVSRIDPALGPLGPDGVTPVGAVDFTSGDLGGNLYNYSDMTGSTLTAPPNSGTWTVVFDSGESLTEWGKVGWNELLPEGAALSVTAASSEDGIAFSDPPVGVVKDVDLDVPDGRYLKVSVVFNRAPGSGLSPILYDLTISIANEPPDCSQAAPSVGTLWPVNHKFVPIDVLGVTDPEGDAITINIDSIFQDEPVDTYGDGRFTPDGQGVGTPTAEVRAERTGTPAVPGNGRVYHIGFTATDAYGLICTGEVLVNVPHDKAKPAVDDGALYDSTFVP